MLHIWLLYSVVLLSYCTAAPTAVQVKLLSDSTGRYVKVTDDGEINASGSRAGATLFYLLFKSFGFQLQLQSSTDRYLVVAIVGNATSSDASTTEPTEDYMYVLRVDYLSHSNLSYWTISDDGSGCGQIKLVLPDATTNCYVAFDSDTLEAAGPCGLAPDDTESNICIEQQRS